MRSFKSALFLVALFSLLSGALAHAATVSGTVTNKTTNKPSSGDAVVLVKLAATMEEEARTKSDAGGHFTLDLKDASATHLIRVTHQGVNYFRPAPPGTTSVEAEVPTYLQRFRSRGQYEDFVRDRIEA